MHSTPYLDTGVLNAIFCGCTYAVTYILSPQSATNNAAKQRVLEVNFLESTGKSGKVKLTMELEINEAAMELIKANMAHMMDMASQMGWRPGGKGKMGEGHMGMMKSPE